MLEQFDRAYAFLQSELDHAKLSDGRLRVVVAHFGAHRQSIAPQWQNDEIAAYFINHLPEHGWSR